MFLGRGLNNSRVSDAFQQEKLFQLDPLPLHPRRPMLLHGLPDCFLSLIQRVLLLVNDLKPSGVIALVVGLVPLRY